MSLRHAIAAIAVVSFATSVAANPVEHALGSAAFRATCNACHAIEANARPRLGPSLHAIPGRTAGTLSGYPFTLALRNSAIIWDAQSLDQFLANPMGMVPGTKMDYGVRDGEQRRLIIQFLLAPRHPD